MGTGGSAHVGASETLDERGFYTELRRNHDSFVPVVGSGLSIDAGAPDFCTFAAHLLARAARAGAAPDTTTTDSPFDRIDAIARALGDVWLRDEAAAFYRAVELRPTPALQALSKLASGIIVTTNYDLAVEIAAESIGVAVESLTLSQFDLALRPDPAILRVVHLHGVCTQPESIVLTEASYTAILERDDSKLLLRSLGTTHRFIFLGHRLDPREAHIRRDLRWTVEAASSTREPHLLVTSTQFLDDPTAAAFRRELEEGAHIRVMQFEDPERQHQATVRAAHAISRPATADSLDRARVIDPDELDAHYRPLPMAPSEQVSDAGGLGAYTAIVWREGQTLATDLDTSEPHMIIEAEGGAGKSQELLQIARRSDGHALVQRLASFQVDSPWHDPGARFVAGMESARAVKASVPRLTLEGLIEGSFTLLLDGLDEVSAKNRSRVLELLTEVALAYPQHRFVIASRPLPELTEQKAFVRWTPMPNATWVDAYATSRGVDPARLREALPDTGDVGDLIVIPIYAAAAVGRVYAREPLPGTALELVCSLTDQRLGVDTRIEAAPETVRIWLDRLALAMQLSGKTELSAADLSDAGLHRDLPRLAPTEDLLAELAARALLRDSHGVVRFPANVMKEARVARALLESGPPALDLVQREVLIELDVSDIQGRPVRAVHPAWINVLELLLPAAGQEWRDLIEPFDPTLVARATSSTASREDRAWAVETLWNSYEDRRIWLERRSSVGNGSSDRDQLVRLVSRDVPAGFAEKIRAAASHPERTTRGNAMELVPHVLPVDEALEVLTHTISDEDPVVQRQAAAAGWALSAVHPNLQPENPRLRKFVDAMANEAIASHTERMAADTLISAAIDLAPEQRAMEIAVAAPGALARRAVASLAQRMGRTRILQHLKDADVVDTRLLDELLEDRHLGRHQEWAASDIATLAHIVARLDDESHWHGDAVDVLALQPAVALFALLEHPLADTVRLGPGQRLIAAMDGDQITALLGALTAPGDGPLEYAGAAIDPGRWNNETVRVASTLLSENLRARQIPRALRRTERSQDRGPGWAPRAAATEPVADIEIRQIFDERRVAGAYNPLTRSVSYETLRILTSAAESDSRLDAEQAAQLFDFLLDWEDAKLEAWLTAQWSPDVFELVAPSMAGQDARHLLRVAELLPGPWSAQLGDLVLSAVADLEVRDGRKTNAAMAVGARAGEEFLRERLQGFEGSVWADTALVRLRDCGAEARMIARLVADPSTITRHPSAQDEDWISSVSCPESAPALAALIKTALCAEVPSNDLGPLSRALDRTAGLGSLRIWEHLSKDPQIPGAAFLYYEHRSALAALLEAHRPLRSITNVELVREVVATIRPPTADRA